MPKNLHISKKSSTFAADLEIFLITTIKIHKIMKKHVYVISSTKQNDFLVFGNRKRAEDWIEKKFNPEIFDKSTKKDLYVCSRIIF